MLKTALVTGASSGLGRALSYALSERGIALILNGRNRERLQETALKLPPSTQLICSDLAKAEGRKEVIRAIQEQTPDLIINNAGFGLYGPAYTHPTLDLKEMVEVNIQALMEISVDAARLLKEAGKEGIILNVSSAAAFSPYPNLCVYAATKAFVNSFSQGLDQEMKRYGIRILAVCPGQIDTEFRKRASKGVAAKKRDGLTMPVEKAAHLILAQIDKKKGLSIIDYRYKISVTLSKLLPKRLLQAILEKTLEDRY